MDEKNLLPNNNQVTDESQLSAVGSVADLTDSKSSTANIATNCPQCTKPYSLNRSEFKDDLAILKCSACSTSFFFAVEQIQDGKVPSYVLDLPDFQMGDLDFKDLSESEVVESIAVKAEVPQTRALEKNVYEVVGVLDTSRICPKCHASNSTKSENCEVCGINFLKYEILQKDGSYLKNTNKALYRQWQYLLTHYDESSAHEQFIMMCMSKKQLTMAARCYTRVLEVLSGDETAQSRLRQIQAMANIPFSSAAKSRRPQNLRRHGFSMAYGVGGLLISAGFFLPASRNLVGAGVALLIVAYGVQTWLKSESI